MFHDGIQLLGLCQTKVACAMYIIILNLVMLNYLGVLPDINVKVTKYFGHERNTTLDEKNKSIAANNTLATKESIVLFWTFNYFSDALGLDTQTDMVHFDCGKYMCGVTKNRTYLKQSHVIVFNPRVSKGRNSLI